MQQDKKRLRYAEEENEDKEESQHQEDVDNNENEDEELDLSALDDIESPEELMKKLGMLEKDPKQRQIHIVSFPTRLSHNIILNSIIIILLNTMLIFGMLGYLGKTQAIVYNTYLDIFFYSLTFSVIELIAKELLFKYFPLIVIKTLGTILLLISVLSFLVADLIFTQFTFSTTGFFVLFLIVFLLIRTIINNLIMKKKIEKYFMGGRKNV